MKKIIFSFFIICALIFSNISYALEGSFLYVSLSYGRGWWPWSCVMIFNSSINPGHSLNYICLNNISPRIIECPFEDATISGIKCSNYQGLSHLSSMIVQISVPSKPRIINSKGEAIKDYVCKGEKIKIEPMLNKGEWWSKGGVEDSPPIFWVNNVEKFVLELLDYHNKTEKYRKDMCRTNITYPLPTNFKDEVYGIPLFWSKSGLIDILTTIQNFTIRPALAPQVGNVVCSLKLKEFKINGKNIVNEYYVELDSEINLNYESIVECTYFYYGVGSNGNYVLQEYNVPKDCNFAVYRVPTIIQAGPNASYKDWKGHDRIYEKLEDFFRIGTIKINKTLKVVEPNPSPIIRMKTFVTDNEIYEGEKTVVRAVIENEGETPIMFEGLKSDVNHSLLGCDFDKLNKNEKGECLIEVIPNKTDMLTISMSYEYSRCGADLHSIMSTKTESVKLKVAKSCKSNEDCSRGEICCSGFCRDARKGFCDDIDGDGMPETWIRY